MGRYDALVDLLIEVAKDGKKKVDSDFVPIGVSNRHVHLSQNDLESLFGSGYELTKIKDISQPGQFACKETVTIAGPKGAIEKVRVLGPTRKQSQVEILKSDCFKLGINAAMRMSGDLDGTPGITLIGPKKSLFLTQGAIVAKRHIHMLPRDARRFGVTDGQVVSLKVSGERGGILGNVVIRVTTTSALECHIDTEEANAMDLKNGSKITIIK
ncbi:MAG: phosphate propanoyltransferase [Anaeroglobus sp.]|nr:phosphate propanoyltransferase [Anaeroglobus sp.]